MATFLRDRGISIWVDQLDIPAGTAWDTAIEHALKAAEYVVVLLSPSAVSSQNVLDEIGFALDERKRLVTVLLQPCNLPLRLRRYQYIDCSVDLEGGLSRLARTLGHVPSPPDPAPAAPPAAVHAPPATVAPVQVAPDGPGNRNPGRASASDKAVALGGVSLLVGLLFALLGGFNAFLAASVGFGLFWLVVMTVPDGGWFRLLKAVLCVSALLAGVVLYVALLGGFR